MKKTTVLNKKTLIRILAMYWETHPVKRDALGDAIEIEGYMNDLVDFLKDLKVLHMENESAE